jgi:hypothetical protein
MIRKTLQDYYAELENKIEPIEEYVLGEKIGEILNAKLEKLTNKEELAEYIAFQFMPHYVSKDAGWGTYHGPMIVWKNDKGEITEFPSIKQVDEETLNYWKSRAGECKQPILAYRYADLAFDFEPVVLNKGIDFTLVQKIIDSGIEICDTGLDDGLGCKSRLERCLGLAIQINDNGRIQKLKEVIITIESKYAEDDKPGLWGYAFQWLVLDNAGKISLSDDEKNKLIDGLEDRLKRLMSAEDPDPWRVERAVSLLAPYYLANNDEISLKRVLDDFETAFRKNKYSNSDGMLISNYLEKLIDIYLEYSSFQFAKDARARIVNELSNLGERGKFATHEISTEIKITKEEIAGFIASIFGTSNSDSLDKVLTRIAGNFILRKKSVEDQLNDLSKNHPFTYLIGHVMSSEEGYPIVKFGSIDDDYDKHLLENFSRNLHFQAVFLRIAFEKMREVYTPEQIAEVLFLSPVFRNEDKNYVSKLLESFWKREYLAVSCLSIPLIEDAVRNIYRVNNQTYIKSNGEGGYDVLSIDALLRKGLIKVVFQTIGEDIEYYLRVLLTERIGWNLRNNFAHGINKQLFEGEDVANRLVHVLICLSLVRENKEKK